MIKDYEIIRDGPVLTIVLGEELATGNAPALMEEVAPRTRVCELR